MALTYTFALLSGNVPASYLDVNFSEVCEKAANLSDLTSASTARTNLGLGSMATQNAGAVAITGGSATGLTNLTIANGGTFTPVTSDGAAIGSSTLMWADLFLASGGVVNWNNGDVTITHSANTLSFAGASSGYSFDDDILLASAAAISWDAGDVTITHSSNTLTFTGASSGYVFDALLNISGAAAGQIQFPATQNASANANTLDDYEEGTWTPALQFGGAAVGMTYSLRTGVYTKIGNVVHIGFNITLSAKGSSTGSATIANVPFAQSGLTEGSGYIGRVTGCSSLTASLCIGVSSTSLGVFQPNTTGIAGTTDANYGNGSLIRGGAVYTAAT